MTSPKNWYSQRESNPHVQLGKLPGYHYIMPASRGILAPAGAITSAKLRWTRRAGNVIVGGKSDADFATGFDEEFVGSLLSDRNVTDFYQRKLNLVVLKRAALEACAK